MYDLIILGSGPAGLSAAVYASRAGMTFAVIEKEFMGTGQIAYTEIVDNYRGYYGIDSLYRKSGQLSRLLRYRRLFPR